MVVAPMTRVIQTRAQQQRFVISEVAAHWHDLIKPIQLKVETVDKINRW